MKFFVLLILGSSLFAADTDYSDWRGKDGDGIADDNNWNPTKLKSIKELWSKSVGSGYSAVSVSANTAYTIGNNNGFDTLYALDTLTGKEKWTYKYRSADGGGFAGPRVMPVVYEKNVYIVSRHSVVYCVNSANGKLIWSKDLGENFGVANLRWGFSGTIKIIDGRVFLNGGKNGVALDAKTGKKVWASAGQGAYASPVQLGKNDLAVFGAKALHSVSQKTGKVNWSYDWRTEYDVNAADPLVIGNYIFISSGYGRGSTLLNVKSGKPQKVWENQKLRSHFSTPIYSGGYIYGVDGQANSRGALVCLKAKTGELQWSEKLGFGSFFATKDKLIYLTERGKLHIVSIDPKSYKEIASAKTSLSKTCWTMPVLSNGLLFCRNDKGKVICVDLRK